MKTVDQLLPDRVTSSVPAIKGRIRPHIEYHYNDLALAAYETSTTGTVTALNLIAEGNDNVNRLGRKALIRDVSVRGFVSIPTPAPIQQARIMLVWDNAAAGALPAITDVLTGINSTSFINVNNVARFTVLHDQTFGLGVISNTATVAFADAVMKQVRINCRINAPTEYSGTGGTIASIQNGTLLLLTMGSIATGATASNAFLATRVTFTDVL